MTQKTIFATLLQTKHLLTLKIHYDINPFQSKGTIVTIGTFDGVHLGHKEVIDQIRGLSRELSLESMIFTFFPHPRMVVHGPDPSLRLLNTLEEKIEQLEGTGIDHLVIYPFTKEFATLSYDLFVETVLIGQLKMTALVIGHDHRLGKNREGGYENLLQLSEKLGFSIYRIEQYLIEQTNISSTKIRNALQSGDMLKANRYLGYPYLLKGTVKEGNRLGRTIGFPTANIETSDLYKLIPAEGVYAVQAKIDNLVYPGILNIGYRPTVNQNADHRTIEVHIIGFDKEIYNKEIILSFHERLRDEMKFDGLEALKEQLNLDKIKALSLLSTKI